MKLNGRIWYADGSTVDFCTREDWLSAPDKGVIRVAQPGLGHIPGDGDVYWMDSDGYVNHSNSLMALRARFERLNEPLVVKYGETITYKEWKALDGVVVAWFQANVGDCGCG